MRESRSAILAQRLRQPEAFTLTLGMASGRVVHASLCHVGTDYIEVEADGVRLMIALDHIVTITINND